MSTYTKKRKTSILIGLIVLILLSGWYALSIGFDEALYTKKGTLSYYLTINSELIKDVPKPKMVGEPSYYSSCGDGPKPPAQGIIYRSRATQEELLKILDQYATEHEFVKDQKYFIFEHAYDGNKSFIHFTLTPENGLIQVSFVETY